VVIVHFGHARSKASTANAGPRLRLGLHEMRDPRGVERDMANREQHVPQLGHGRAETAVSQGVMTSALEDGPALPGAGLPRRLEVCN
jgi:hypothetical protein